MTAKIRVAHIVQDLRIGGLERCAAQIAATLDRERFDCELWALSGGGPLADYLRQHGCTVRIFDYRRYLMPWNIASLAARIRKGNFHVVHTHSYPPGVLGRLCAKLAGVPVVFHHHHSTTADYMRPYQRLMERLLGNHVTDRTIACSSAVRDFLYSESFNSGSIAVLYNGIPASFAAPSGAPDLLCSRPELAGRKIVVTVASLAQHKGHRYLLEAIPAVLASCPGTIFVLVGDGPERQALEAQARARGIEGNVLFAGLCDDVRPWLESADLYVQSSLREALGLSIIEAMAKGLAVVATDIGGIPEAVTAGETGFLVPSADPDTLARCIVTMLSDDGLRKRCGENGKRRFEELFSLETMMRKLQDLYVDCLADKGIRFEK